MTSRQTFSKQGEDGARKDIGRGSNRMTEHKYAHDNTDRRKSWNKPIYNFFKPQF
jgi:hypothetical protein